MRRLRRYSLLTAVVLIMFAAIQAVACGDGDDGDDEEEPTPIPTAAVTPARTAKPSPTPAPTDTAVPTRTVTPDGGLDISRAAYYLDASAVLPGFSQIDLQGEGQTGLGPEFSEPVGYVSGEPFQVTVMVMTTASGEAEKADWREWLQDEQSLEEVMQAQAQELAPFVVGDVSISWRKSNVGDMAKMATCTVTSPPAGPDLEYQMVEDFDFLVFYQDAGPDAAVVWIRSYGSSGGVDVETIGQEVSTRIGSQ